MFHFEHQGRSVIPMPEFLRRLARSFLVGVVLIVASLAVGMAGYAGFEGLGFIDAFVNAAMLLSGMGPMWQPQTDAGKVFAGLYALYSGLAVIVIAGIVFAPAVHRFLHVLHVDEKEGE